MMHGDVVRDKMQGAHFFVHAKFPEKVTDPFFKRHIIPEFVETTWGTLSIVMATLALMRCALNTTECSWFMLMSHDSYPCVDLATILSFCQKGKAPSSAFEVSEQQAVPNLFKTSQWWIMNRSDVATVLKISSDFMPVFLSLWNKKAQLTGAADEYFFLSALRWKRPNYSFRHKICIYTLWLKTVVSQHPFIWSRWPFPAPPDGFFIRKTMTLFPNNRAPAKTTEWSIFIYGTETNTFTKPKNTNVVIISAVAVDKIPSQIITMADVIVPVIWNFLEKSTEEVVRDVMQLDPDWSVITLFGEKGNTISTWKHNIHVAFLFLTRDNVHFPDIWQRYFENSEFSNKIHIFCHAKTPEAVTVPWQRENLVKTVPTAWGHITEAYFELMRAALKWEPKKSTVVKEKGTQVTVVKEKGTPPVIDKMVTISESCLPCQHLDAFYLFLQRNPVETSYLRFMKPSPYDIKERIQTQPNYKMMEPFIKHYARFCISRYHAKKMVALPAKKQTFFHNMHVGDEFFWTLLHPTAGKDHIQSFEITYDNWDYVKAEREKLNKEIKKIYDDSEEHNMGLLTVVMREKIKQLQEIRDDLSKNPKSYREVTQTDVDFIRKQPSFFWRKFPVDSDVRKFYSPPRKIKSF
jgi:hypothetical protein